MSSYQMTMRLILTAAAFGALASCQSAPTPDAMSRATTETAPADLQLLCASSAATTAKIDAAKVLPVSSAKVDEQTYAVQVDAGGTKYSCTVGTDGVVKSVLRAV